MRYMMILMLALSSCATIPGMTQKQTNVLKCIREMKEDYDLEQAFQICRQLYGLKTIQEKDGGSYEIDERSK
jgi:hypothetical protein